MHLEIEKSIGFLINFVVYVAIVVGEDDLPYEVYIDKAGSEALFRWNFNSTHLDMEITGRTQHWIGVGFTTAFGNAADLNINNPGFMDVFIGWIDQTDANGFIASVQVEV